MAQHAPLNSLSITDLNRELSRRRRALPALQQRLNAPLAEKHGFKRISRGQYTAGAAK